MLTRRRMLGGFLASIACFDSLLANTRHVKMSEHDIMILTKTVYGEARGEGEVGIKAVVHLVLNRVRSDNPLFKHDETISKACLRKEQFECWDFKKEMASIDVKSDEFLKLKSLVIDAHKEYTKGKDLTKDALFYVKRGKHLPKWAWGMRKTTVINHHVYFKLLKI